jgi:ABC-type nitrate/sulfonate/bicarbonate transport system ATPase subunit/ABC-type nitrate/sulfonate/bicarbonate transport system permease component
MPVSAISFKKGRPFHRYADAPTDASALMASIFKKLAAIVILVVALAAAHWINPLIPLPWHVFAALFDLALDTIFWTNLLASLTRVLVGLAVALVAALALSFGSFLNRTLRFLAEGVVDLLRPIPPIAWIPLSVALFGLSEMSSIFVIFIGAFFPIFLSALQALTYEGRIALQLAELIRGKDSSHFFTVVIPASLPTIFTGLKTSIGFAWMVVVVAEMIAVRSGLGYVIQIERQLLRLDYVVAYMVVIGAVGAALSGIANAFEALAMPHLFKSKSGRVLGPTGAESSGPLTSKPLPAMGNITLTDVAFRYDADHSVFDGLDLQIEPRSIVAVVGRSGSGKTTLLELMAGIRRPASGTIEWEGATGAPQVAWVTQRDGVFVWLDVGANVLFGSGRSLDSNLGEILPSLEAVGLAGFADRFPNSLSGGQRQRIQLARAMASQKTLFLFDEPFSALDALYRDELIPRVRRLIRSLGATCVFVTHDLRDAIRFSDTICIVDTSKAGVIARVGIARGDDDVLSEKEVAAYFTNVRELLIQQEGLDVDNRGESSE